jgi:hypothetical protein
MRRAIMFATALATTLVAAPAAIRAAPDQTLGMALMSALVRQDGMLLGGAGATSSSRHQTGRYRVFFNRSVVGCDYVATQSHSNSLTHNPVAAIATAPGDSANSVWVVVRDGEQTDVDRIFRMIVFCPK